MKRISVVIPTLALAFLASCKKDSKAPEESTPATPAAVSGFSWTVNGATVKADSGFFIPAFNNIVAYKNGASVDIVLSALTAGTYSISSATGNTLDYATTTATKTAVSGTVGITANASNKLSGSFSAALAGSTVTSISGEFTNIPGRN